MKGEISKTLHRDVSIYTYTYVLREHAIFIWLYSMPALWISLNCPAGSLVALSRGLIRMALGRGSS